MSARMSAREEAIRLLSAHLQAASILVDALRAEEMAETPEPDDEPGVRCPHCGNVDPDTLQESSTSGEPRRLTCLNLSCRRSFNPGGESNG